MDENRMVRIAKAARRSGHYRHKAKCPKGEGKQAPSQSCRVRHFFLITESLPMFVFDWLDSYPWYVKWLTITFMVTFGIVLVKGLATLLAETIVNVVSWLIFLPVRLVEKLFYKKPKQEGIEVKKAKADTIEAETETKV